MNTHTDPVLGDGARVLVTGEGISGAYLSYFLLKYAKETGMSLRVDLVRSEAAFETDASFHGFIVSQLVEEMALDGMTLPWPQTYTTLRQCRVHAKNVVSFDFPDVEALHDTQNSGPVFSFPSDHVAYAHAVFDAAALLGAELLTVTPEAIDVDESGRHVFRTAEGRVQRYDLHVATSLRDNFAFMDNARYAKEERPGGHFSRELYLSKVVVDNRFGRAMHLFLPPIDGLEYVLIIPQEEAISLHLFGPAADHEGLRRFLETPELQRLLPLDETFLDIACEAPVVQAIRLPLYADRFVRLDASVLPRAFGKGILSAYLSARTAASMILSRNVAAPTFEALFAQLHAPEFLQSRLRTTGYRLPRTMKLAPLQPLWMRTLFHEQQPPATPRPLTMILTHMMAGKSPLDVVSRLRDARHILFAIIRGVRLKDLELPAEVQRYEHHITIFGRLYNDGDQIIMQGAECDDRMYIIHSGRVDIVREHEGRRQVLSRLEKGEFFGEMALLDNRRRSASAFAKGKTVIVTISKERYLKRIMDDPYKTIEILTRLAGRIPHLAMKNALPPKSRFIDGEVIFGKTKPYRAMAVIISGTVTRMLKEGPKTTLSKGEFFCETALFDHAPNATETYVAKGTVELHYVTDLKKLHALFADRPDCAVEMIHRFSERIRRANDDA